VLENTRKLVVIFQSINTPPQKKCVTGTCYACEGLCLIPRVVKALVWCLFMRDQREKNERTKPKGKLKIYLQY